MSTNKAILCIGSNVTDADAKIAESLCKLSAAGCEELRSSGNYRVPQPDSAGNGYLNCVVEVSTHEPMSALRYTTKQIEANMGRTSDLKPKGIVPIDIDVVMFNGDVVRSEDFASDYFITGYMRLDICQ